MGNESIPVPVLVFVLAVFLSGLLFVGSFALLVLILGTP
jgi:hypothetical protein